MPCRLVLSVSIRQIFCIPSFSIVPSGISLIPFSFIFKRGASMSNIIASTMSPTVEKLAISVSIAIIIVSKTNKIIGGLYDLHHFLKIFLIFFDCAASALVSVDSVLVVVATL